MIYIGNPHEMDYAIIPYGSPVFGEHPGIRPFVNYWHKIDWGDGTVDRVWSGSTARHTYVLDPDNVVRYAKIYLPNGKEGIREFHSRQLMWFIQNTQGEYHFANWLKQFPNIESIHINTSYKAGERGNGYLYFSWMDWSNIPDSVKKLTITTLRPGTSSQNYYLNFSNFSQSSKLEEIMIGSTDNWFWGMPYEGDLAKMPPNIKIFSMTGKVYQSNLSYTPGRVWAAKLDRVVMFSAGSGTTGDSIATQIIDDMLIDIANSGSMPIGQSLIRFRGVRSSASDAAVAILQDRGFTVTINL